MQYEAVVSAGNEAIVHHIEVFECSPHMDVVPQYSGSCDSKMKPAKLNSCRHVLAAWALGAEVNTHTHTHCEHTPVSQPSVVTKGC